MFEVVFFFFFAWYAVTPETWTFFLFYLMCWYSRDLHYCIFVLRTECYPKDLELFSSCYSETLNAFLFTLCTGFRNLKRFPFHFMHCHSRDIELLPSAVTPKTLNFFALCTVAPETKTVTPETLNFFALCTVAPETKTVTPETLNFFALCTVAPETKTVTPGTLNYFLFYLYTNTSNTLNFLLALSTVTRETLNDLLFT